MDLCAYCVAALLPRNTQFTGNVRVNETGLHSTFQIRRVPEMVESGSYTFYAADNSMLPMRAVTTVRGTLVCVGHAFDALKEA